MANWSASAVRSPLLNHSSIPSSFNEAGTSGGAWCGYAASQAALSWSMIVPSAIRVSERLPIGYWPCLADRVIVVSPNCPARFSAVTTEPTSRSTWSRRPATAARRRGAGGVVAAGLAVGRRELLRGGHRLEVHPEEGGRADP